MKIIKLKAGLGNQMFQYAFAKLLEQEYGEKEVLFDTSYFKHKNFAKYLDDGLNMLSVEYKVATKHDLHKYLIPYNSFQPHHFFHRFVVAIQAILNKNYYFEKNRNPINIDAILKYPYLDGYWQSWRYLEPIRSVLLNDFQPKNAISDLSMKYINQYKSKESVFVGVRKGDYTKSKKSIKKFGVPSLDYYIKAFSIILEKIKNPYFIVFSDDIDWVKTNFGPSLERLSKNKIEYRSKDIIFNNFEEMYVMSSCRHAIISNSTFNFWGAWMIDNEKKVIIAPEIWFKDNQPIDIIPSGWIKI